MAKSLMVCVDNKLWFLSIAAGRSPRSSPTARAASQTSAGRGWLWKKAQQSLLPLHAGERAFGLRTKTAIYNLSDNFSPAGAKRHHSQWPRSAYYESKAFNGEMWLPSLPIDHVADCDSHELCALRPVTSGKHYKWALANLQGSVTSLMYR